MPSNTSLSLCILAFLVSSSALRFKSDAPQNLEVHIDTTCGTCHSWLLDQFQPLWRDQEFQQAMTKFYNISFWAHTITRHSETFTLNLALDCASKHFSQPDFVDTLLSWESHIEPWAMASQSSGKEGGSGPTDTSVIEVHVEEDDLLKKSVPKHRGFDGVALVKTCMATEVNETVRWVKQHTPEDFHEVPLVLVDNVPQPDAIEGLQAFLCLQMGKDAPASCSTTTTAATTTTQSLLQQGSSYCKKSGTAGQMLIQEHCGLSKMINGPTEFEDSSFP